MDVAGGCPILISYQVISIAPPRSDPSRCTLSVHPLSATRTCAQRRYTNMNSRYGVERAVTNICLRSLTANGRGSETFEMWNSGCNEIISSCKPNPRPRKGRREGLTLGRDSDARDCPYSHRKDVGILGQICLYQKMACFSCYLSYHLIEHPQGA